MRGRNPQRLERGHVACEVALESEHAHSRPRGCRGGRHCALRRRAPVGARRVARSEHGSGGHAHQPRFASCCSSGIPSIESPFMPRGSPSLIWARIAGSR